MAPSRLLCKKVLYDNNSNYRYIVSSYENGIQVLVTMMPYKGCWIITNITGKNLSITV